MCLGLRKDLKMENVVSTRMRRQAERWGSELYQEDVEFVDLKSRPFTVQSSERKVMILEWQYHLISILKKIKNYSSWNTKWK